MAVARDDSVIRGSLIAAVILVVLSLALNFFLWRRGNLASEDAERAQASLSSAQQELRKTGNQLTLLKAMMGVGQLTDAEFDLLKESASGDPDMESIERQFAQDMAYMGPDVDAQNRNYPALPKFLVNAVRTRNDQYGQAREELTTTRQGADAEVANARKELELAQANLAEAVKDYENQKKIFNDARTEMNLNMEKLRDQATQLEQNIAQERSRNLQEQKNLNATIASMQQTIDQQLREISSMRNDEFETAQGEIVYSYPEQNQVTINLGSADALRPGVTFNVFDADEARLSSEGANAKATIEVIRISGRHLAIARVVDPPAYRDPILKGDKIHSVFWAPGRKVRIALAGMIDIDGDGHSDVEQLRGMITAAGGEVAAVISPTGETEGSLDGDVRFLVMGETPELPEGQQGNSQAAEAIAAIGRAKAQAQAMGITILPAWKMLTYLKTMDDSLTTPLGSASRGTDFPPDTVAPGDRLPSSVSDLFNNE